ncbi:hypothetical protein [Cytophaga aurantiaca]|uniref:hypothetical protein n=1 Tax=Cytophaga aurantiaca TaxID=29530 RepID=UPI0012FA507C|nr:hypothetical protein [Cytophaga aurantiaca]
MKKLFAIGVLISFIVGLVLVKALPVYKMGIFLSTQTHQVVDTIFLYATIVYYASILWVYMHHRFWIKLMVIPLILFLSYFFGMMLNYWVFKPVVISIPALYAVIDHWEYNMDWFRAFSIAIMTIIIYYIEQYFFYWVRSGSKTQS